MPGYLLHVTVSPNGDNSFSRQLAKTFVTSFAESYPDVEIRVRDLNANPVPHLTGEDIAASFTPAEARSASQSALVARRMELIDEIKGASAIVLDAPMWNWNVPSVLKAYIDQLVFPGAFDTHSKSLTGKSVTVLLASGGAYGEGSWHPEYDHLTGYLKTIFTVFGSEDVEVIRTEYTLAGVVPGMEGLVDKKAESLAVSKEASSKRAKAAISA